MDLVKKGFQLPKNINFDEETLTANYGKLVIDPLERGFGTTIGNSLRRVLLSSIEGSAVVWVRINGVLHEFSTIKSVKEDVVDILLNIKKLRFKMIGDGSKIVTLNVAGPKTVTGSDIETVFGLEVLNSDCYIATVDRGGKFEVEFCVKKGTGYVPAELNKEEGLPLDIITLDSVFSPIKKVNFWVEKTRVGRATDYDRLIMEIWTDGSITPEMAVSKASSILIKHFVMFIVEEENPVQDSIYPATATVGSSMNENLFKSIEDLELSVRALNCLKNANITTVADLVHKTEHEILRTKNFGKKSLDEIKDVLTNMGLSLGMGIDEEEMAKLKG